ncbi:MAG: hypothetical protein KKF44_01720 [Nanoarchaeota archaeon]|nr:hypothetical protein [Nanoarchaeota archaeon]
MIDIAELEQYFPDKDNIIEEGPFTFRIVLSQDIEDDIFAVNLKIRQADTKEGHLIKFKLGIGKDRESDSKTHKGNLPHFEIEIYKREESSFAANIYFMFEDLSDEVLLNYGKGTLVIISKIIERFIHTHRLNKEILTKIIFSDAVHKELNKYEPILIDALYECYKNSNLVVRQKGEAIVIKTPHNLTKYLSADDLNPLYLPLFNKASKK